MKLEFDLLSIDNIDALKVKFLEYISEENSTITLDLSEVNKIDLCAIQLLLSLQKTLDMQNRELFIENCTQSVQDALYLCGCETLLGCNNE